MGEVHGTWVNSTHPPYRVYRPRCSPASVAWRQGVFPQVEDYCNGRRGTVDIKSMSVFPAIPGPLWQRIEAYSQSSPGGGRGRAGK